MRQISAVLALIVGLFTAHTAPLPAVGDIYVANIRSSEITVFDGATGAFQRVLVARGASGLRGATGIAFGPDGYLYVSSSQTNQILRYDPETGVSSGPFVDDSLLATPFSLTFGPDRNLYVSSGRGHVVRRYDGRTGAFLGIAAADSTLQQPIGLAFGADDMLYVVNSAGRNVMRFDPATGRGAVFASDSLRFPSDLAFGPDGDLYVTDASRGAVVRFDARSGAPRGTYAQFPQRSAPVGMAFAGDGRLFVGAFGASQLFLVPPHGGDARMVADTGLAGPENLAIRPQETP